MAHDDVVSLAVALLARARSVSILARGCAMKHRSKRGFEPRRILGVRLLGLSPRSGSARRRALSQKMAGFAPDARKRETRYDVCGLLGACHRAVRHLMHASTAQEFAESSRVASACARPRFVNRRVPSSSPRFSSVACPCLTSQIIRVTSVVSSRSSHDVFHRVRDAASCERRDRC